MPSAMVSALYAFTQPRPATAKDAAADGLFDAELTSVSLTATGSMSGA
jgi:hypothetical protein